MGFFSVQNLTNSFKENGKNPSSLQYLLYSYSFEQVSEIALFNFIFFYLFLLAHLSLVGFNCFFPHSVLVREREAIKIVILSLFSVKRSFTFAIVESQGTTAEFGRLIETFCILEEQFEMPIHSIFCDGVYLTFFSDFITVSNLLCFHL